jgi:glucokinase
MSLKYLLVDVGGTNIKMGLMDDDKLTKISSIPSYSKTGIMASLEAIVKLGNEWLKSEVPGGIGLAFAGIVDFYQSRVVSVNEKFSDAVDFDFRNWALTHFNCPIIMENDARAALIGEWKYGAGRGSDNLVMLTIGTGIGSSAVINGDVLRGKHCQAGCLLGHLTIDYNGEVCNCGNLGCVETVGSTWALERNIKTRPGYFESSFLKEPIIDFETVFRLANNGDLFAMDIREQCLKSWAVATVNAIHAYDPEMIVLGGGVMKSGDIILKYIEEHIKKYAWTPWGKVDLKIAELNNDAALWGMNYLLNSRNKVLITSDRDASKIKKNN